MSYTATYSPEDNKLRLYSTSRLDSETYARVKAAGFIWAPKQDLFVAPMWTPSREDLLIDLAGEIEDEDRSLVDRAEERADRFSDYKESRIEDAQRAHDAVHRIADNIPFGQPIRILAPMIGVRKKKDSEAEKDITKQNQPVLVGFRTAHVFDVEQTSGAELPQLKERAKGEVGEYRERLIDFIIAQGIELEFKESIAPALGMSYGGKIAILPGQTAAEEFGTLVHEASHELLHKSERRTATTKTVRETEAEAIAFVVSQTIGLDAGKISADYIHLYHGNAALLAESLEVIQRTSALILSAIETPAAAAEQSETEADPVMEQAS
jgi:Domain of unknown function (DUF3560)